MSLQDIIGYLASICMIFGYMPQAIVTIRTRDTDGIALPTFIMLGLGSVFFVVNGILSSNIPLVITNVITTVCSVIIFGIKIHNDRKKRRLRK
ncbi:MAG: SemiSWEET family sugar transporter [Muribaculaceae bacterium]